jgi:hypothetical protein
MSPRDVRTLILVEGESDAAAVRTLAGRMDFDLDSNHVELFPAAGVTNFPRVLAGFVHANPGADFCGMYDVADERYVRRALATANIPIAKRESLESFGFFACVEDLEDELIRALGTEAVEDVLEAQDEIRSFRRFQAMPEHRRSSRHDQLRRFLGTRATRKIRCAQSLVEVLDFARMPRPLAQLVTRLADAGGSSRRK